MVHLEKANQTEQGEIIGVDDGLMSLTILMILMSIQLFDEVVRR